MRRHSVSALELKAFDANTLESLGLVEAGDGPTHSKVDPDNRSYVTDTRGDAILIYQTRREPEQIGRVPLHSGRSYGQ